MRLAALAAAASALMLAPSAEAGFISAHPTEGGTPIACTADTGYVMSIFDPRYGYRIGLGGIVTQWRFQGGGGTGTLALQILDQIGSFENHTPVAESAVEAPTATGTGMNTFITHIPVVDGQYLGLRVVSGAPPCLAGFPGSGDGSLQLSPAPLVGSGSSAYGTPQADVRLNVAVKIESDFDGDGFGDDTEDGCTDKASRHDDCVRPIVTMDKGKPNKRKAKFEFSSNEPGTFQCHLEKKPFKACTSPLKFKRLKPGLHNFTVRAVDLNGNISTATSFQWKVAKPRKPRGR